MRAALILAAGASTRFGRADKLLAPLGGRPLLLHAIAAARAARPARLLVTWSSPRVARLLRRLPDVRPVRARTARRGLSASLAAGLHALRPVERELLVFLGDMPDAAMPRRLRLPAGAVAIRPMVAGIPGHPLLVRTAAARTALREGDRGLASLAPAAAVRGTPGHIRDIDHRAALRRWRGSPMHRPAFSAPRGAKR